MFHYRSDGVLSVGEVVGLALLLSEIFGRGR